jgi:hypothetical protein
MKLFKRAALFGDIHFGEKLDAEQHNHDCLDFIEWFRDQVVENKCDTIIFMGDWFHNRIRTDHRTGHYSKIAIELLNYIGLPIYWIVGNHDIYLKGSRDIHSLGYLSRYSNITLIDSVTQMDEVVFSPWLVGEETNTVNRTCKYIFGHFELPFFLMNQVIEKTYDGHGLHIDDFTNCEAVYSGHFHKRQVRINKSKIPIYYIGNCFGHNMNDANDPERGMAILEWGETLPTYIEWTDAPTYHKWKMSDFLTLLDQEDRPYGSRATIEIIDDLNLSIEDLAEVKKVIDARQVRINPSPKELFKNEAITTPTQFNSLDEMVEHKLFSMSYDGKYDAKTLVDLYRTV